MVSALSVADSRSDLTSISANASARHLGAAIVTLNENDEVTEFQQIQVGPMDRWSVHVAVARMVSALSVADSRSDLTSISANASARHGGSGLGSSGRKGHLGAAIVTLNENDEVTEFQQIQVGPMDRWHRIVAITGTLFTVFKRWWNSLNTMLTA
jgi:hypothetical protein